MGHVRSSTAYGLSTDRDEHWTRHAACRHDPDAFFAPADFAGRWRSAGAVHLCLVHCPVLDQCRNYADTQPPADRTGMVLGGVAYDSKGQPARCKTNPPPITCPRCRYRPPLLAAEPIRHGSAVAVRWHRDNNQPLCPDCRNGERYRRADRARKRAQRAAEGVMAWTS